jgi:prephenate dehydrogenase
LIVSVIGPGLIGGSMALTLREKGLSSKIIGVDKSQENGETAIRLGIIDEVRKLEEAMSIAELVIIAIPVDATLQLLPRILDIPLV